MHFGAIQRKNSIMSQNAVFTEDMLEKLSKDFILFPHAGELNTLALAILTSKDYQYLFFSTADREAVL